MIQICPYSPARSIREGPTTQIRKTGRLTGRIPSGKGIRELGPEVEASSEMRKLDAVTQFER